MRGLVASGQLAAGDRVPSTRELAGQLGVSRGSVVTAYDQLISEGLLKSSQGAATVVHPELRRVSTPPPTRTTLERSRTDRPISLKPSAGTAGAIRPAAWRRAWREAASRAPAVLDRSGQPELRHAIAEHLRLARGLVVHPDSVLVTGGSREGLLLILMSLGRTLNVGVETPGHPGLRNVIPLAGHTAVSCETDDKGLVVSALPEGLDALLVTPSHLYPIGGSMPATRRAALLDWAAERGVVLIEDDFNSELRYRVSPLPTLGTLPSKASVIALGTFSTLLTRQLSAGYVVADAATSDRLRETRDTLGMPVSPVTQYAIAHLLEGGFVRRNTKSTHKRLTERKGTLGRCVLPALRACGAVAIQQEHSFGVDLVVKFPDAPAHDAFVAWLAKCGVVGASISDGLLLSFGHLSEADFERVVGIFSAANTTRPS
nr:PLP-dependent aminotransferase family protein [Corynebacterium lipophiloflavum]